MACGTAPCDGGAPRRISPASLAGPRSPTGAAHPSPCRQISSSLRHLDLRRVSEDERRAAAAHAKRESERAAERARQEAAEMERAAAASAGDGAWERARGAADDGHESDRSDEGAASGEGTLVDDEGGGVGSSVGGKSAMPSPPGVSVSVGGAVKKAPSPFATSAPSSAMRASSSVPDSSYAEGGGGGDEAARRGGGAAGGSVVVQRIECGDGERGHIEVTEMANGGVWLHAYGQVGAALPRTPSNPCGTPVEPRRTPSNPVEPRLGPRLGPRLPPRLGIAIAPCPAPARSPPLLTSAFAASTAEQAADSIDKASRATDAVGVTFSFYPFDKIAAVALPKLRAMRRLRELHLEHNEIHELNQLLCFTCLPGLTALRISAEGNPIVAHPLFRSFATSMLPMLRSLDGVEVTPEQRGDAERHWRSLKQLYQTARTTVHAKQAPLPFLYAMNLYEPSSGGGTKAGAGAKEGRGKAAASREAPPPAPAAPPSASHVANQAAVAAAFVDRVIDHAVAVDEKITQLNAAWPHIVSTYQERVRAEVADHSLFLKRYAEATRGDAEGLAVLEPIPLPPSTARHER